MKKLFILKIIIFIISLIIFSVSIYFAIFVLFQTSDNPGTDFALLLFFTLVVFGLSISLIFSIIHYFIGRKFESNKLGKVWLIINIIAFILPAIYIISMLFYVYMHRR